MKMLLGLGAVLLATSAICGAAPAAPVPKPATQTSADAQLKALYDGYAIWDDRESGVFQNSRGELERSAYLPRVDEASQLRRAAHLKELLDKLNAIQTA